MSSAGAAGGAGAVPGAGARGGAAPGAVPGRRGGGIALDFRRGKTSKERLEIDWQFPVWKPPAPKVQDGHTVVAPVRYALPLEEAFKIIAAGDRRPLLVLRECELCKGSDHALLNREMDNEQTVLMTHWFRCVKLPPHVMADDHPFYRLFEREKGDRIPHLFFASWDGTNVAALPGDQSQAFLWKTMYGILDREYTGNAEKSVKEFRKLLNAYDAVDGMILETKARIDTEIDKRGPKSPKLKKLYAKLDELMADREELVAKEAIIRALALRSIEEEAKGSARASGSAR